jgi:hypothetical protein
MLFVILNVWTICFQVFTVTVGPKICMKDSIETRKPSTDKHEPAPFDWVEIWTRVPVRFKGFIQREIE